MVRFINPYRVVGVAATLLGRQRASKGKRNKINGIIKKARLIQTSLINYLLPILPSTYDDKLSGCYNLRIN